MSSVVEAAESGVRLDLLVAMRSQLAQRVGDEDTAAKDLAPLARLLKQVAEEIEALERQQAEEAGNSAVSDDEEFDPEDI